MLKNLKSTLLLRENTAVYVWNLYLSEIWNLFQQYVKAEKQIATVQIEIRGSVKRDCEGIDKAKSDWIRHSTKYELRINRCFPLR